METQIKIIAQPKAANGETDLSEFCQNIEFFINGMVKNNRQYVSHTTREYTDYYLTEVMYTISTKEAYQ